MSRRTPASPEVHALFFETVGDSRSDHDAKSQPRRHPYAAAGGQLVKIPLTVPREEIATVAADLEQVAAANQSCATLASLFRELAEWYKPYVPPTHL